MRDSEWRTLCTYDYFSQTQAFEEIRLFLDWIETFGYVYNEDGDFACDSSTLLGDFYDDMQARVGEKS